MQTAEGFAMDLSVLNIDNCYDYNKLLHLLESLRDPCGNCRHIIGDVRRSSLCTKEREDNECLEDWCGCC